MCINTTTDGWFQDGTTKACTDCVAECIDCDDAATCNTCRDGFQLSSDSDACIACGTGIATCSVDASDAVTALTCANQTTDDTITQGYYMKVFACTTC